MKQEKKWNIHQCVEITQHATEQSIDKKKIREYLETNEDGTTTHQVDGMHQSSFSS